MSEVKKVVQQGLDQWFLRQDVIDQLLQSGDDDLEGISAYADRILMIAQTEEAEHQTLEDDEDIFDPIVKKGIEWVIWECIEDLAIRDNYPKLRYAARDRKAECESDIIKSVGKRGRDKPNYRKNTRQRRLNRGYLRFFSNTGE